MASYPVTVYRWDDPGAPQLVNGTISSFFNVLQKCLVEGYGTKAAAGWSVSLNDPGVFSMAFRNDVANGASGGSVQFYSETLDDRNETVIRIRSMRSVNADYGGFVAGSVVSAFRLNISSNSRWVLIATRIGFYFYTYGPGNASKINNQAVYRVSFYAGDFFSVIPNDGGRFIKFHGLINTVDSASAGGANEMAYINEQPNGSAAATRIFYADNSGHSRGHHYSSGLFSSSLFNNELRDNRQRVYPFILTPIILSTGGQATLDEYGTPLALSTASPMVRGCLPGIYMTTFPGPYGEDVPLEHTHNGETYHWLPCYNNSSPYFIIKTDNWHDPFS